MNKNLLPKSILIVVLVALAVYTLFPPAKKLMPGIDLAGGTSLIYEIDTEGLTPVEEQGLSQRMILLLRRRVDPANIQNLLWRPQGNTRFEIQMPLASAATRQKRHVYELARDALLARNVNPAKIMRSLKLEADERAKAFETFAQNDPNRLDILQTLAKAYDARTAAQARRDELQKKMEASTRRLTEAAVDMDAVKRSRSSWAKLDLAKLKDQLVLFLGVDPNDPNDPNVPMLTEYVTTFAAQIQVYDELTAKDGLNDQYNDARREIDKLNLTAEALDLVLDKDPKATRRIGEIDALKTTFADRADQIDAVVAAYDEYRPSRGQLDDPQDLKRMLKGAGILEFRILPTEDGTTLSAGEIQGYLDSLQENGPKYASDSRYQWCEIEDPAQFAVERAVMGTFGEKAYVLASNKPNEVMLHSASRQEWKLVRSEPTTDNMGRRAIGFLLDDRGGVLFAKLTGANEGKPLCILLDKMAISAPTIEDQIGRQGIIRGTFTQTEVSDMVNKLNAGSLPARLIEQPISEKTIGPSIGADNRDQGIRAGLIGLVAVMGCMLLYYLMAGAIADVALLMNILFVLAIMAGLRATFTLPGIAGIILTIGMSVDANVLIFERIREEQARGAGLLAAIRNGYERAFRAIFDANLTTFITAAILYWVASEEIKGFAIVLMLGILSSMFTALFVTRVIFDQLVSRKFIKEQLVMLRLIHQPNVDWMGLRKVFFAISGALMVVGLSVFFLRDDRKNNKYDIEFTGGTSVQVNLNTPLTRQEVEDRIHQVGEEVNSPGLAAANVYSIGKSGKQFEISTTATNDTTATVTFASGQQSVDSVTAAIKDAEAKVRGTLTGLAVRQDVDRPLVFHVTTTQINPTLVRNVLGGAFAGADVSEPEPDEVVSDAIKKAFAGELEIQENLQPTIHSEQKVDDALVEDYPELADYIGGIRVDCSLGRSATLSQIDQRIRNLRFKPDAMDLVWYDYTLLGPQMASVDANQPVRSFVFVSADPESGLRELDENEWTRFVENEKARILAAGQLETSLPRVTQIDPSVGFEQKQMALVAIVLSLLAIVAYIWVRFGDLRYGLAAIAALVHDVIITLGAVTACTYIASTVLGPALLVGDFKINLAMIAAFLTLIGYSLNDTIVVFDRIRENRLKAQLTAQTITNSINQMISRTLLTSFTTFIVVLIMYIFGGAGLRGFTFAIGFGVVVGTYSSIAIAAPILLVGAKPRQGKEKKPQLK